MNKAVQWKLNLQTLTQLK